MSFRDKSKKGVSIIIGYVLLVTFAIVIGLIVFQWMKSYVPKEDLLCPDGVSIFIKNYACSSNILTINLKNNGKFDVGGYFIYATDSPNEELATIDLSKNNTDVSSRIKPLGIKFGRIAQIIAGNTFEPDEEEIEIYNLTGISNLFSIEIIPLRWQKEKNRNVIVSCKDAKISEIIKCDAPGEVCISESAEDTCARTGAVCGFELNNCLKEVNCGSCALNPLYGTGYECNSVGQCVTSAQCTENCASVGWECHILCGKPCGPLNGDCPVLVNGLSVCNSTGKCVLSSCNTGWGDCNDNYLLDGCETTLGTMTNCASCGNACTVGVQRCENMSCTSLGNGVCDAGETCAQEPTACEGYQASCISNNICVSGICTPISAGFGCTNYCVSLLHVPPYLSSSCMRNTGQCGSGGGIPSSGGDTFCVAQNPTYGVCCCFIT